SGGFGYNPVFFDPLYGMTAAEMDAELKNQISHRARALEQLRDRLHQLMA
ncbi:MAG TPA: non-canonical purine NTP pyrophosphatase, partial [Xylella taiwanensis]